MIDFQTVDGKLTFFCEECERDFGLNLHISPMFESTSGRKRFLRFIKNHKDCDKTEDSETTKVFQAEFVRQFTRWQKIYVDHPGIDFANAKKLFHEMNSFEAELNASNTDGVKGVTSRLENSPEGIAGPMVLT